MFLGGKDGGEIWEIGCGGGMMYICINCGGLTWEEYYDYKCYDYRKDWYCYRSVCKLEKDCKVKEIDREFNMELIAIICADCESENLLYIGDKEIDKLNKLVEVNNEERLKLIKEWGWNDVYMP